VAGHFHLLSEIVPQADVLATLQFERLGRILFGEHVVSARPAQASVDGYLILIIPFGVIWIRVGPILLRKDQADAEQQAEQCWFHSTSPGASRYLRQMLLVKVKVGSACGRAYFTSVSW
jgi:hypothetical protein